MVISILQQQISSDRATFSLVGLYVMGYIDRACKTWRQHYSVNSRKEFMNSIYLLFLLFILNELYLMYLHQSRVQKCLSSIHILHLDFGNNSGSAVE